MSVDLENYFRAEARDLLDGLLRGFLDLEKQPQQLALINQCFRLAHTLKGAARAVKKAHISEMAHLIEEALLPFREDNADARIEADLISDLLKIVDSIQREVERFDALEKRATKAAALASIEQRDSVRIELAEMDRLLENLSEATVRLGALGGSLDTLSHAHRTATSLLKQLRGRSQELRPAAQGSIADTIWPLRMGAALEELVNALGFLNRDLTSGLSQLERELIEVTARANDLRLVPVSVIFSPLELAVRDAAQLLHKRIEFHALGGDVRIEGHVLSTVHDALLHALRNAVDHGIEIESERLATGKPAVGCIALEVKQRGRQVVFRVMDDGRGVRAFRAWRRA